MCCILEGLRSDLGQLFRQFFLTCRARLSIATRRLIGKLSGQHQQQRDQNRLQQQEQRQAGLDADGQPYEFKMMSKKGLLKFVKYTLIFSNAFGFILSIFLGLFGIAYPDKHFPLSYKGREMALCSLFCMLFTTIGCCGAQNHRRILLIIYGATNVIIVIIVVILWFLFRENSILGNKEISNMFITTLAITIAVMFLFAFILAFHIRTFKDDAQDSIVSQSHQLLQQTTAFLQQQQQQHQLQQQAAAAAAGHLLGAPPHLEGGDQTLVAFGMNPHSQQQHSIQQPQQRTHHQSQLGGPPHHAMHQQHHLQQQQQQQQQEMMMLGHHHAPTGPNRMAIMGGPSQPIVAPTGPSPSQAIQMTHIKPGSGTNQRQKSLKAPGGGQLMMQQGASTSGHQVTLMRNQSSPLPGVGTSNYQTTGRQVKGQQPQQVYSQSQKHARGQQPPETPSPPSPPPPPAPPQSSSSQNHVQQPPPNNQQAQHHHQQQHHQSVRRLAGAHIPPACPVQYCTFDCDRTV